MSDLDLDLVVTACRAVIYVGLVVVGVLMGVIWSPDRNGYSKRAIEESYDLGYAAGYSDCQEDTGAQNARPAVYDLPH
jgi:hypothetical protein